MDHKNNLFSEAQLDNRRRSKKISNWALELQQFNIVRVWIRGEANILGDAPSRAPWETHLARNLPIPVLPLRQIIQTMYRSPEALEKMVQEKKQLQNLDEWPAIENGTPRCLRISGICGIGVLPEFGSKGGGSEEVHYLKIFRFSSGGPARCAGRPF